MYTPLIIICLRLFWPYTLLSNHNWNANDEPRWYIYGKIAVGMANASSSANQYFIRQCYKGKALSAAFGINFHFGRLTAGHHTGLRKLLLVAGDVESNPGPTSVEERTCPQCGKIFGRVADLNKHVKRVHENRRNYSCELCDYTTLDISDLRRHEKVHSIPCPSTSSKSTLPCEQCDYVAKRSQDLKRHLKTHEGPFSKKRRVQESDQEIKKIVKQTMNQLVDRVANKEETALQDRLRIVELEASGADPQVYLTEIESKIKDYVEYELERKKGIKLQLVLSIEFYKQLEPWKTITSGFRSKQQSVYRGSEFDVSEDFSKILASIDKFIKEESGWIVKELLNLQLHMATCKPLRGSTYRPLPKKLANKEAIINIRNEDQKCFIWSVLAKLHPVHRQDHPNRASKYQPLEMDIDMRGIDLPVPLDQITKFEKQNNLAINVYGFDDTDGIHPLRISKTKDKPWIHLMLYDGHYSLIKNLNRLLYDQTRHREQKFFCPMCLIPRTTQQLLNQHIELCKLKDPTKVTMPDGDKLKFSNTHRSLRQPLVIYADFECLTEPLLTRNPNPEASYTQKYQKHTPCGYGMVQAYGCCGETQFRGLEVERCQNAASKFLQSLMMAVTDYHNKPTAEMIDFDPAKHASNECHICGEEITERKVRDHCHICGKYRGPAHNHCNQNLRLNKDVVVVFHNLRRYDGHLIMRKIGDAAKLNGFEISVVAKAMDDYISFSLVHKKEDDGRGGRHDFKYNIKFIDSVQFLNNSLDGLVNNLDKGLCKAMATEFTGDGLELLLRKGVYPYDHMKSWKNFEERELPPQGEFYSQLNDEHIGEEDYGHAKRVWDHFGIQSMGEYHDLYLKTDVLLLADVFEKFRQFGLDKYGLDPCHYMTAPSLAWDACLKMTGVELELLQDAEMYLFCESGIRGGISMISHRHAKANNPQMEGYDPTKPLSYIVYLDANNLYGWAMVQKLPVDGFKWVEELDRDWASVDADGDKGYFLEVDLEYPAELHDEHNDYPLAPETMEIHRVSDYCEHLKDFMRIHVPICKKLVPNLFNKSKYILHIRNLHMYLRLGMKLRKVHRAIEFNQRAWMERYIMFNTRMRAEATNNFDKDLLKLMNNAVFGKTMENVRKYRNIELVTSSARFEKLVANPRFQDSCRFTEDLVGVSSLRPSTCLNKPIYCGLTVLDLSKVLMYEFHYDYIKLKYGNKAKLLFTDTDSLCYWIQTGDIFADMKADEDRFDFSGYPRDHPCYSVQNKKVIGKMKDEADSEIIEEFAGLRPKMYSIYGPRVQKKRAKGIKKRVVKYQITHNDYVNTLMSEGQMFHEMKLIRSHLHEMFSIKLNKKSLSAYDDKRWLLNAVDSRAHGHYLNNLHAMFHRDI